MHLTQRASPILRIPEVLLLIFGDLNQHDLASCARVCTLWNEIAQEMLWRHLPSLLPVLMLVGDLQLVDGSSGQCDTWSVGTDWTSVDWDRVRSRAHCIYSTHHSEENWRDYEVGSISFDDMVPLVSALSSGTQHAFPRLRHLAWQTADHPTSIMQILLIVGPSLEVLDLEESWYRGYPASEAFDKLFTALRYRQDVQLQKFRLRLDSRSPVGSAVYQFLRTQQSLQSIDMDVSNMQEFVRGVYPTLERTVIDVKLRVREDYEDDGYKPLLKLHLLESIDLHLPIPREIDLSDVDCIGTGWRNLKCWRCPALYGGPEELVALAAQLPKLEELGLDLILDGPMLPPSQPIPRLACLRKLDASFGFIDEVAAAADVNVAAIAELLTTICPDSSQIEWVKDRYYSGEYLIRERLKGEINRIRNERTAGSVDLEVVSDRSI